MKKSTKSCSNDTLVDKLYMFYWNLLIRYKYGTFVPLTQNVWIDIFFIDTKIDTKTGLNLLGVCSVRTFDSYNRLVNVVCSVGTDLNDFIKKSE